VLCLDEFESIAEKVADGALSPDLLERDIAAVFHDSEAVNRALRLLIDLARREAAPSAITDAS
jgi:hypothetical protein